MWHHTMHVLPWICLGFALLMPWIRLLKASSKALCLGFALDLSCLCLGFAYNTGISPLLGKIPVLD